MILSLCVRTCVALSLAAGAAAQCLPAEVFALEPPVNQTNQYFGWGVGVWGDTALVSAVSFSPSSLFVFERDPLDAHVWHRTVTMSGPPGFGFRLAIEGDLAAVSGGNVVSLRERNAGGPGAWGQVHVLTNGASGNGDNFGRGLAISGDTIAVGASSFFQGAHGSVHVFRRDAGGPNRWGRVVQIFSPLPNSPDGKFGEVVALDGDTLLVSDPRWASWDGNAYVFERNVGGPDNWGLAKVLDPDFPNTSNEQAGSALALRGDTALVGVPAILGGGVVRTYERNLGGAGNWGLHQDLRPSPTQSLDFFGASIAFDGARALIGAPRRNEPLNSQGAVYVFERSAGGASWAQTQTLTASDALAADEFGVNVALSGATVVVGNQRNAGVSPHLGKAHVFDLASPQPPTSYCTAGTSSSGCSGTLFGVGAASASQSSGFDLVAVGLDGARNGGIFYGVNGPTAIAVPGTGSWRCVRPPLQRIGVLFTGASAGSCDGVLRIDWNAFRAGNPLALGAPFAAGQTVWAQAWIRDALAPAGLPATQGLSFVLCP